MDEPEYHICRCRRCLKTGDVNYLQDETKFFLVDLCTWRGQAPHTQEQMERFNQEFDWDHEYGMFDGSLYRWVKIKADKDALEGILSEIDVRVNRIEQYPPEHTGINTITLESRFLKENSRVIR